MGGGAYKFGWEVSSAKSIKLSRSKKAKLGQVRCMRASEQSAVFPSPERQSLSKQANYKARMQECYVKKFDLCERSDLCEQANQAGKQSTLASKQESNKAT